MSDLIEEIAANVGELTEAVETRLTRLEAETGIASRSGYTPHDDTRPDGQGTRANREADWLRQGIQHATRTAGWTTGDDAMGEAVSPAEFVGGLWDRLAARSVVLASGATVVQTEQSEAHIPAVTGASTASWKNESATISETIPTGDLIEVKPTKLAAIIRISREAVDDSAAANPATAAVATAARVLVRDSALKLDYGFLEGSGSAPEPRGLRTLSGAQDVDTGSNGHAIDSLDYFADAITLAEQEDATPGAWYMAPAVWGELLKLHETDDSIRPVIADPQVGPTGQVQRSLFGIPVFLSSQIDTDEAKGSTSGGCSWAYLVDPSELLAVRRQDARVEVDYSAGFGTDDVLVRIVSRWGFAVPNPKAVVRIPGLILSA